MTGNISYISIISLNVNGLNSSIKRHRLADWIKKKDPSICFLQENNLIEKDIHRLRRKDGKKHTMHMDSLKRQGSPCLYQIKKTSSQSYSEWIKENISYCLKEE